MINFVHFLTFLFAAMTVGTVIYFISIVWWFQFKLKICDHSIHLFIEYIFSSEHFRVSELKGAIHAYVYRGAQLSISEKPARNKSVQAKIHVHTLPRRNILVT